MLLFYVLGKRMSFVPDRWSCQASFSRSNIDHQKPMPSIVQDRIALKNRMEAERHPIDDPEEWTTLSRQARMPRV